MEFIEDHKPGRLGSFFDKDLFVYANVPYRIKPYQDLLKNPKDTIDFDEKTDEEIHVKREQLGADGALLRGEDVEDARLSVYWNRVDKSSFHLVH